MRIVCPACSAAYDVPDALLGTGRPVRCARCGREWAPEAKSPEVGREAGPDAVAPAVPVVSPPGPSIVERSSVDRSGLEHSGAERSKVNPSEPERPNDRPLTEADQPVAVMEPPLGALRSEALVPPREHPVAAPGDPLASADDRRRQRALIRLAWAASVVLILLLGWAAYEWRTPIMHAWPASERLYAALGLAGEP